MRANYSFIILLTFILLLPATPFSAIEKNSPNLYTVQTGDTLPNLAKKFDTTTKELKATNGLQSNTLLEGQQLRVPRMHEVTAGETLEDIALAYHSTPRMIKSINNLSTEELFPGQILHIKPKRLNMKGQHILMTREEFKDWLLNHQFSREIHLIQQHHTWRPSYKHFKGNNYFQMLESMQNHHMKNMGWNNIAQNITIFPDGKVAVSRPFNSAPEGSIGPKANAHGIAIENIGDFDRGQDIMTDEQKESIIYVTALLSIKFGLKPSIDTITYHHWWHYKTKERVLDNANSYEVKSCPGSNFFGGNSTDNAKKYFYPLVEEKMKEIANEK